MLFLFVADLCNYLVVKRLNENTFERIKQVQAQNLPDKNKKNMFLQRIGFMHIFATFKNNDCDPNEMTLSNCKLNLEQDDGLLADWAFTIFSLFYLVHSYLRNQNSYELDASISTTIIDNYTSRLSGTKRVAFLANMFASFHYDFFSDKSLQTENIGRKILEFVGLQAGCKYEIRIYKTFTRLLMADMFKHNDQLKKSDKLIEEAKLNDRVTASGLHSMWIFLSLYSGIIKKEIICLNLDRENHKLVTYSECSVKWRKALGCRLHENYRNSFTDSTDKWNRRLGGVLLNLPNISIF